VLTGDVKMTIKEDAGKVLLYFYKNKLIRKKNVNYEEFKKDCSWDYNRVITSIEYNLEKKFLVGKIVNLPFQSNPQILKFNLEISSDGIDVIESSNKINIENSKNFYTLFNFNINIDSIIKGEAKLF